MNFLSFTLKHETKGQWVRFEPTKLGPVFVTFKGACGTVMENTIDGETMATVLADLYTKGYREQA
jgi:hypothetical protein